MTIPFSRLNILLAFALASICLFWGLGSYGLLHNNEGLYAQIPREMLERGNYIIPYLNGVPYIEKPPLLYWLIALCYKLFGIQEFAARLVPATAGFMTLITTYIAARTHLSERAAFLSVLVLGTSLGYAVFCRMVFFDVVFTLFLASALICYFAWEQSGRRTTLRWGYVLMGLAILAKGLVALILAGLVVFIYTLVSRKPLKDWWQLWDTWGMLLFLTITVPWHVLAAKQDSNFAWFYFINEHFLRFLGMREPKDYYHGPFYYYTYRVVIYLLPWSLLLPLFLKREKQVNPSQPFIKFLAIWFWAFFIFFSISKAKANYYLITALPPLALLLGYKLDQALLRGQAYCGYLLALFHGLPIVAASTVLLYRFVISSLPFKWITPEILQAIVSVNTLLLGMVISISFTSLVCIFKKYIQSAFLLTGMASAVIIGLATHIAPIFEHTFSARPIVEQLKLDAQSTCLYRDYEKVSSFVFYLSQPLPIIDSLSNDLFYGQTHGYRPDLFLTSNDPQTNQRCAVIIVYKDRLEEFKGRYRNYQPVYIDQKVSVWRK